MLEQFRTAQNHILSEANSPVRSFKAAVGDPASIQTSGTYISDIEDKEYVDDISAWGTMILGHAQPEVIAALVSIADNSHSFDASTEIEIPRLVGYASWRPQWTCCVYSAQVPRP